MPQEFDIVFAGGGTTACVIAGRLIATDPSIKILIIESGQHSRDVPRHTQPFRYAENLAPHSATVTRYTSKPSTYLNGRSTVVSCGRCVGGGSAVNSPVFRGFVMARSLPRPPGFATVMFYVRGAASDYNGWAALGNNGWSFDELLPFIKKVETFNPVPDRSTTHGYSGPIQISNGGFDFDVGRQFLDVGRKYDPNRPQVDDNNDFETGNAYSPVYHYIDPATGRRSDPASRYLYPHSNNPNLTIMVGTRVKRVIIENGRAVGVKYVTDAELSRGANSEPMTVKASKWVVLSAGAFGSPMILERSGIGAPSILTKNSIRVQVDLPGVGENYHEHPCASPAFFASDETETMHEVWDSPGTIDTQLKEWEEKGTGKIAHTGIAAILKLRPTDAQLSSAGPALQERWETFFRHSPDKPMAILVPFAGSRARHLASPDRKLLRVTYYILYPDSAGSVHITSGENLDSPPDFDISYFTKEGDVAQFTLLYKFIRELIRRMPAYRGEVADFHPKFPAGSQAACNEKDVPVPIDARDIMYTAADDEAIEKYHRDTVGTTFHSLGTCAMKPRNQGGVVDARLNVYGVEGLKVADLSICPTNVGNNTYSTALLIGEKAAAIVAEDLGYENV